MEKKKVLLIVNPCAGRSKSKSYIFDIINKFSAADYEFDVKTTTGSGDATEFVKKYATDHDIVVCCGGDGTFNETINGVMSLSRRIPIGYIPAGSTNDLANTIGLPTDIDKSTDTILAGKTHTYDIGMFNNRFFCYVASFGVGVEFSYNTPQKMKNLLGHYAYILNGFVLNLIPTLKNIKPIHIKIEYDDKTLEDDFYFGAISNSTSVAGIFKFDENEVKLDDGKFELLLVRRLSGPMGAFGMFKQMKRREFDGDKLIFLKSSNIKMTFDEGVPWTLDGEYGGSPKEVRFSVLKKAIDIISDPNPMFEGKESDVSDFKVKSEDKSENEQNEIKEEKQTITEKLLRRRSKNSDGTADETEQEAVTAFDSDETEKAPETTETESSKKATAQE